MANLNDFIEVSLDDLIHDWSGAMPSRLNGSALNEQLTTNSGQR
jgi:hypothetical protein